MQEVALSKFRNVDQPFESFFYAGKRTEIDHIGDQALNHLPDAVTLFYRFPGIGLQPLDAECHATMIAVNFHHVHFDLVTTSQHVSRMSDSAPTQFADVDKPFKAAEVNKSAKVAQVGDTAPANIAFAQGIKYCRARPSLDLGCALRKNKPILDAIQFNNTQHKVLTDAVGKLVAALLWLGYCRKADQLGGRDKPPRGSPFQQQTPPSLAHNGH